MSCGDMYNFDPHHIVFKSQGGKDEVENLISLCFYCHRQMHDGLRQGTKFINGKKIMMRLLRSLSGNQNFRWAKVLKIMEERYESGI